MKNLTTVTGLLNNLRNYQDKLHQLSDYRQQSFLSDFTKIDKDHQYEIMAASLLICETSKTIVFVKLYNKHKRYYQYH